MHTNGPAKFDLLLGVESVSGQPNFGNSAGNTVIPFDFIFGEILQQGLPAKGFALGSRNPSSFDFDNSVAKDLRKDNVLPDPVWSKGALNSEIPVKPDLPLPFQGPVLGTDTISDQPHDFVTINRDILTSTRDQYVSTNLLLADEAGGIKETSGDIVPSYSFAAVSADVESVVLSKDLLPVNESVRDSGNGNTLELPPGKYLVVDSSVHDGLLSIEVVSSDKPESIVRISLPVSQLQTQPKESGSIQKLIPVLQKSELSAIKQVQLDDYFAKLNHRPG